MNEEFYIGQIFDGVYPPEAAIWCNANKAFIIETGSVMLFVPEEYEETLQTPIKYSAMTHIEIDEDGNEHEIIDQPEHEEIVEEIVVKTREVEKEVRQYQIVAIPEPTLEELQARIRTIRNQLLIDTDKYVSIPDFPISKEIYNQYIMYREYLRDYTLVEEWWLYTPMIFEEWVKSF